MVRLKKVHYHGFSDDISEITIRLNLQQAAREERYIKRHRLIITQPN